MPEPEPEWVPVPVPEPESSGPGEPGWGAPRELLFVLAEDATAAGTALDVIGRWAQVTARLPPRLALVVVPAGRLADAAAVPGVLGVFATDVPVELAATLDPRERLFVDGWLARAVAKPPRPFEGRPWDEPT
ncbi:hypothetical protein [Frankia sp. CcI49]|uniref:hypothetical protein n=1 Tax=Frankia sp. CcI49 TaxID=1745382 RepID=UPI001F524B9F|nr:hypothetical protein [Frankia sp. CcI49]